MRVCKRRDSCIIEKTGNCVFDSSNKSMKYQKENMPSWLLLLALPMLMMLQSLPLRSVMKHWILIATIRCSDIFTPFLDHMTKTRRTQDRTIWRNSVLHHRINFENSRPSNEARDPNVMGHFNLFSESRDQKSQNQVVSDCVENIPSWLLLLALLLVIPLPQVLSLRSVMKR